MVINNAVFIHSHILSDGTVIVHAHPYNKTNDSQPFKSHKHSKTDIILLQNIQQYLPLLLLALAFLTALRKFHFKLKVYKIFLNQEIRTKLGRAPPVL